MVLWIAGNLFFAGPVISIENQSSIEIESIHITGVGFDEQIERLGPGETTCVRPSGIRGESSLGFRAMADRRVIEATDLTYLESHGGYRVRVEVLPTFQVRASYGSARFVLCGWLS